jgi:predicted RNase H-like nuclease (RuvC/YqgF family)
MTRRPKKDLSDLLREEVQKKINSEVPSVNITPPPISEDTNPAIPTNTADEIDNLQKLTSSLARANQRTKELEKQVNSLSKDLASQKALGEQLQKQLAESQQLQEELTEQKNLVHRLYADLQHTQALETELKEHKQLVQQLQTELEQARQPKELLTQRAAGKLATTRVSHPIHYIEMPSVDIDKDIGWFD